jgi:hypothetical protein
VLTVPGGHVGAVVGSRAARDMYPALARWFSEKLGRNNRPIALVDSGKGTPKQ